MKADNVYRTTTHVGQMAEAYLKHHNIDLDTIDKNANQIITELQRIHGLNPDDRNHLHIWDPIFNLIDISKKFTSPEKDVGASFNVITETIRYLVASNKIDRKTGNAWSLMSFHSGSSVLKKQFKEEGVENSFAADVSRMLQAIHADPPGSIRDDSTSGSLNQAKETLPVQGGLDSTLKKSLISELQSGKRYFKFSQIDWPENTVDNKERTLKGILENENLSPERKIQGIETAVIKARELDEISKQHLEEYQKLYSLGKSPKTDKLFRKLLYDQHSVTFHYYAADILETKNIAEAIDFLKKVIKNSNSSILYDYLLEEGVIYDERWTKRVKEQKDPASIPRPQSWLEFHSLPADQKVFASHGGGWLFLQDFILGKKQGYELEQDGYGIQVHPSKEEDPAWVIPRENQYSNQVKKYFDYPAKFKFEIPGQYLDAANNGYEAGLRLEFLDKASNFVLENLETGELIEAKDLKELKEKVNLSIETENEH